MFESASGLIVAPTRQNAGKCSAVGNGGVVASCSFPAATHSARVICVSGKTLRASTAHFFSMSAEGTISFVCADAGAVPSNVARTALATPQR